MRASAPALFPSRRQASDERLVARVRAGDARAFEAIYDRYERPLRSFCRHLLGHPEDADDAVQHTFLAAYRTIHDGDRAVELRPWLFTVARNRCRSLLRSRRHNSSPGPDSFEPSTEGLTAAVERRESLRDLLRDIAALPEDQRAALILTQLETLKHDEVAKVLDVPSEKVRALVFQARSSLASTRRARDTACHEIREQLSTLSGPALRRGNLRRHVHECSGCRDFELTLKRQRAAIVVLLPVVAAPALRGKVLGEIAGGGTGAAGAVAGAGAGAGAAGSGGALSGLAGGGLAVKAAVLAVSAAVAGTGVATVRGGGLPDVGGATHQRESSAPVRSARDRGTKVALATTPGPRAASPRVPAHAGHPRPVPARQGDRAPAVTSPAASPTPTPPPGSANKGGTPRGHARQGHSPPGLAKQGGTPPGLVKKNGKQPGQGVGHSSPDGTPPGQAKGKKVTPPGQANQPSPPSPPRNSGGHGNPGGNGNGNGNATPGSPPGNGNGSGGGKPPGTPGGGKGH